MLATGTPLNQNQQNIANAIDTYFNNGGALPAGFINLFNLSGAPLANALTQLDGEDATGAQKSAFQLMQDFLNLLLDPSADGQGGGGSGGQVSQFAPEQDLSLPPDIALAYAHALHQKPPPSAQPQPQDFEQRWSAWASGFGGSGTTDGNASVGSNNVTATDYGYAAGLTYHLTPATVTALRLPAAAPIGIWRNRSAAAGATASRPVSMAPPISGRLICPARSLSPIIGSPPTASRWATISPRISRARAMRRAARPATATAVPVTGYIVGVTPYAALQVQDFHTPSYSETDLTGGGFGLTYNAVNATDTRSELGARFDNLTVGTACRWCCAAAWPGRTTG